MGAFEERYRLLEEIRQAEILREHGLSPNLIDVRVGRSPGRLEPLKMRPIVRGLARGDPFDNSKGTHRGNP